MTEVKREPMVSAYQIVAKPPPIVVRTKAIRRMIILALRLILLSIEIRLFTIYHFIDHLETADSRNASLEVPAVNNNQSGRKY
jgi:hypothetical protein